MARGKNWTEKLPGGTLSAGTHTVAGWKAAEKLQGFRPGDGFRSGDGGGGGGKCLSLDTLVDTPNGPVSLKDIHPGDTVLSPRVGGNIFSRLWSMAARETTLHPVRVRQMTVSPEQHSIF